MAEKINPIWILVAIIGFMIGGDYFMSIYVPVTSCNITDGGGDCMINIVLPAGQQFTDIYFDVTGAPLESNWIDYGVITLSNPTVTYTGDDDCQSCASGDQTSADCFPCRYCDDDRRDGSGYCHQISTFAFPGDIPADLARTNVSGTWSLGYKLDCRNIINDGRGSAKMTLLLDGNPARAISTMPEGIAYYSSYFDSIKGYDDLNECRNQNDNPEAGIAECIDQETLSDVPFTGAIGTGNTFDFIIGVSADDGANYDITSPISLDAINLQYTRNLIAENADVTIDGVSSIGSQTGVISPFQTANVPNSFNVYCGRDIGNYDECIVPLVIFGDIGGQINVVDTIVIGPMPDECAVDSDCASGQTCNTNSTPTQCEGEIDEPSTGGGGGGAAPSETPTYTPAPGEEVPLITVEEPRFTQNQILLIIGIIGVSIYFARKKK